MADFGRQVWSFFPAAVPPSIPNAVPPSTTTLSYSSSTLGALMSNAALSLFSTSPASKLSARQDSSVTTSNFSVTSLTGSLPTIAVLPESSNDPLISFGPYVCTTTINLSTFTSQLLDYIRKSEDTLSAHLIYVIINIHAATSDTSPSAPAPVPSNLPGPTNLLGNLFSGNLSAFLYTQSNLMSDRADLNGSWYSVIERFQPVKDYYNTQTNDRGIVSTQNGWPSESYIEFAQSKRLLLGWGTVDPQMSGYNFSGDSGIIFPNGYIQNAQTDIDESSTGQITRGCFLRNSTDDLSLSYVNSSWATDTTLLGFDYPTSASSGTLSYCHLDVFFVWRDCQGVYSFFNYLFLLGSIWKAT